VHAAVVHSFDRPPRYEELATPEPGAGANNSHNTGDGTLPMIPGIDGAARLESLRAVSVAARAVPLADVEATWTAPATAERIVFTPGP
jgi:hypothetical protein